MVKRANSSAAAGTANDNAASVHEYHRLAHELTFSKWIKQVRHSHGAVCVMSAGLGSGLMMFPDRQCHMSVLGPQYGLALPFAVMMTITSADGAMPQVYKLQQLARTSSLLLVHRPRPSPNLTLPHKSLDRQIALHLAPNKLQV